MNKRLLLMRHAEAGTAPFKIPDFERKLTKRGLVQATEIAEVLKRLDYFPDAILHSAALRTAQTAQQILNEPAGKPITMMPDKTLYNALPDKIAETIQAAEPQENIHTLLVIAHNPGISLLATECGWKDTETAYFPPAGIAAFELNARWIDFKPQSCRYLFFKKPAANL